jgi:phosphatidylserine/phosphatidylglycerophosphate/cardiolipin synthase-like enzyme
VALQPTDDGFFRALIQSTRAETAAGLAGEPCNIRLQYFIFRGDESGWAITEELIKAHRAGCTVQIIVDAYSNPEPKSQIMYWYMRAEGIDIQGFEFLYSQYFDEAMQPNPGYIMRHREAIRARAPRVARFLDGWKAAADRFRYVVGAGINMVQETLALFRPARRVNSRYHNKKAVFGLGTARAHAFVGGANLALEYFRMGIADIFNWRDQNAAVRGDVVLDIAATFDRGMEYLKGIKESRLAPLNTDYQWAVGTFMIQNVVVKMAPWVVRAHDWARRNVNPLQNRMRRAEAQVIAEEPAPVLNYHRADARFFEQRPRMGETTINDLYLNLINTAQTEVTIVNAYFVPTVEIREALKAAARRGVRVTVITNSMRTNDTKPLTYVSRSYYKELMDAGVVIREWGAIETESTVHAKFMVIDRRIAFIGSWNMDPRSWNRNSETGLLFRSVEVAGELMGIVETNDFANSTVITMEQAVEWADPSGWSEQLKLDISRLFEADL